MKTIGIIPARYASSRFPGKPLVDIGGRSMIQRVYERVAAAELVDQVIVATDDERILQNVKAFGGQALMTRLDHQSGTDRCAEVVEQIESAELIVNIQGDEPFIDPEQINQVIRPLKAERVEISTLARRIDQTEELFNANVVKVVLSQAQRALYFSRSPIPYLRNAPQTDWLKHAPYYKHIGLYGFRRSALLEVTTLPVSTYERAESLEQLRWLESGRQIFVGITAGETLGVDTPADLERARSLLANERV